MREHERNTAQEVIQMRTFAWTIVKKVPSSGVLVLFSRRFSEQGSYLYIKNDSPFLLQNRKKQIIH